MDHFATAIGYITICAGLAVSFTEFSIRVCRWLINRWIAGLDESAAYQEFLERRGGAKGK